MLRYSSCLSCMCSGEEKKSVMTAMMLCMDDTIDLEDFLMIFDVLEGQNLALVKKTFPQKFPC